MFVGTGTSLGSCYSLHSLHFLNLYLQLTHFVCFDVSSVVHVFSCTLKLSLKVIWLLVLKGQADNFKKCFRLYERATETFGLWTKSWQPCGRRKAGEQWKKWVYDAKWQFSEILLQLLVRSREIICTVILTVVFLIVSQVWKTFKV